MLADVDRCLPLLRWAQLLPSYAWVWCVLPYRAIPANGTQFQGIFLLAGMKFQAVLCLDVFEWSTSAATVYIAERYPSCIV